MEREEYRRCAACGTTWITPQERAVLRGIAEGLANKEIAVRLNLTEKTVKNYVSRLLNLLDVSNRTGAVMEAIRLGVIDPPGINGGA